MAESEYLQADTARIEKLRQLAASGRIEGPFSYFNHLATLCGNSGQSGAGRHFTDRERERVDLFLASFAE